MMDPASGDEDEDEPGMAEEEVVILEGGRLKRSVSSSHRLAAARNQESSSPPQQSSRPISRSPSRGASPPPIEPLPSAAGTGPAANSPSAAQVKPQQPPTRAPPASDRRSSNSSSRRESLNVLRSSTSREDLLQGIFQDTSSGGGSGGGGVSDREGATQLAEAASALLRTRGKVDDITLSHILEHPKGKAAWVEHLTSEYSLENIHFWDQVQEFQDLAAAPDTSEEALKGFAQEICERFIDPAAKEQVNINSSERAEIMASTEAGTVTPGMFDSAKDTVYALMDKDSFKRFRSGKIFEELVEDVSMYELLGIPQHQVRRLSVAEMLLKPYTFKDNLRHQFPLLESQCRTGIQTVKSFAADLRKLFTLRIEQGNVMLKVSFLWMSKLFQHS